MKKDERIIPARCFPAGAVSVHVELHNRYVIDSKREFVNVVLALKYKRYRYFANQFVEKHWYCRGFATQVGITSRGKRKVKRPVDIVAQVTIDRKTKNVKELRILDSDLVEPPEGD